MSLKMIRFSFVGLLCVPMAAPGQSAPATAGSETTLRANTDLVVVDVVADDERQNPIQHLAATDFTVFEDGKPQTLKVFEEHSAGPPTSLPPAPKFEPGTFTNYSPVPANSTLNILLFDKLNTPMTAQSEVRDQVLKYLKEMQPGTRVAIFALTTQLRLLQGFTSDPELLQSLIKGKKGNAGASPLMNNAMQGDHAGDDDAIMDAATEALGNDPDAATILANLQQFEAEQQSFQLQLRQRYTLDALNQLARYMSMLAGRKNLIWFSGSFPVNILPDPDLPDPFAVTASVEDEFRETVDLLARSQVAVYPIDARGLMNLPMVDVSQSGASSTRNPSTMANNNAKFFQQTSDEHATMNMMAQATGGKAYVNTNGLKEAVEKAIRAGSNYYTLAYTPTNRNWNGDYRKIQVKADHPGITLAYRRGYFADDPNKPSHRTGAVSLTADPTQYSAIRTAMLRGAPDPTELIFLANVRPSTTEQEVSLAPGNQASKKASAPYRRYTVTFLTDPREVICPTTPDSVHHCALDFLTFVYDGDGNIVNMQTNGVTANFPEADFVALQHRRLSYRQQISVPVKGEYYFRIGIRDATSDHVGAVELPVAAVAKLQPATAQTPAPATPAQPAPAGGK